MEDSQSALYVSVCIVTEGEWKTSNQCCAYLYVLLQKVSGRPPINAGVSVGEVMTQTSVTSPGPSFAMLQKLVEESDSKFIVTHEEVSLLYQ